MELNSSWEANSLSISQVTRLLYNPNFHYRIYNNPPLEPILSQVNTVHILILYLFKIHFNIINQSTLCLLSGLFS
jgi:hypothetical protein